MLKINDILLPNEAEENCPIVEEVVVIFAEFTTNRLFVINRKGNAKKPIFYPFRSVASWVDEQLVNVATPTWPDYYTRTDSLLSEASVSKRDYWYDVIQPVIEDLERFLMPDYGNQLIQNRANETGNTRYQIYSYLYKYLRCGQTKNALLPTQRSKEIEPRNSTGIKRGRPRGNAPFVGKNIDELDKHRIIKILKTHYLKKDGRALTVCHDDLLKAYYAEKIELLPDGQKKHTYVSPNLYPSLNQFRYWTERYCVANGIIPDKIRMGESKYNKDKAARTGSDDIKPDGPGHIYQIDATPVDCELISQFSPDRTARVGRATLYWVIDVFTTALVGLHILLGPPSWDGMRITFFNTFRRKSLLAAEFGLQLTDDDWPMCHECLIVYCDNAELVSEKSLPLKADVGVDVTFGRAYRGDDKGLGEKAFDLHNKVIKSRLPGFINKTSKERGEKSPKEKALVTLPELYRIMILYAKHRNNAEEVSPNYLTKDMIRDGVEPRAINIWLWGQKKRPFMMKSVSEEELYLNLLIKGEVSVHREAIYFKGCWYNSEWTLQAGLQNQKGNQNRVHYIECRYIPYCADYILLCTPEGFQLATLSHKSQRFQQCSYDEIELQLAREEFEKAKRAPALHEKRGDLYSFVDDTVAQAQKEQTKLPRALIKNQSISDNKQVDIAYENQRESERFVGFVESHFDISSSEDKGVSSSDTKPKPANKSAASYQSAIDQLLKSKK